MDSYEGSPNEVPHEIDFVLAVGRGGEGLLQVGLHRRVAG